MPLRNVPFGAGRKDRAVLGHEYVGGAGLGDVAERVAHEAIVEAARLRFDHGARVVGIKASGLGVDGHRFQRRTAEGRQCDRRPEGLWHRRLVDAKTPACRFRIVANAAGGAGLGPVHRSDVELGIALEAFYAVADEPKPGLGRYAGFQEKFAGRRVDPRAMEIDVGHHAFEKAGAIEHHRAEPDRVGARPHEEHIALVPVAIAKCPGVSRA